MKIAILTQPLRYNYGGLLQNYALQSVLKEMGHDPVTLDPSPYAHTDWKTPFRAIKRTIQKYFFHQQKIDILREYKKNHDVKLLETNTGKFIKKHINCIRYKKITDINPHEYDAFIVGSDQVWRPKYNGKRQGNLFLDFIKGKDVRRIAYAASFGTDKWEFSEEETKLYSSFLADFDAVSVREDSGVELCHHYFHKEALHVLDPTMLLTKKDYIHDILQNEKCQNGNQLFYYILDENEEKLQIVNDYATKLHLTPFTSNKSVIGKKSDDISKSIQPPVEDWIRGFNRAQFVVTDSFHGSVFSILFNRPFIVILNAERGTSRIDSLLKMFKLEERIYNPCKKNEELAINWEEVNTILSEKRSVAVSFIKKNLDN